MVIRVRVPYALPIMFNLIESDRKRNPRLWVSVAFCVALYFCLATGYGIRDVLASDATIPAIAEATAPLELITQVKPEDFPEQPKPPKEQPKSGGPDKADKLPTRAAQIDRIKDALIIPKTVSSVASKNKELPPGRVIITGKDSDPAGSGPGPIASGTPSGSDRVSRPVVIADPPPPLPTPSPTPKPTVVKKSEGVINGKAISLPQPPYPSPAKLMRQQGTVKVAVVVAPDGRVISAKAESGPPLLLSVSEQYALRARFTSTLLSKQPVQVAGYIIYNFVLQ